MKKIINPLNTIENYISKNQEQKIDISNIATFEIKINYKYEVSPCS